MVIWVSTKVSVDQLCHERRQKDRCSKQVYAALEALADETKKDAPVASDEVLQMITLNGGALPPRRWCRLSGASASQIKTRFIALLRWLVLEANKRSNKQYHTFGEKLLAEMLDALNNQGGAIERKNTLYGWPRPTKLLPISEKVIVG